MSNPTRRLAAKIARELFTDYDGKRASRLAMKHGPSGKEKEGAGWCEKAVADRIEKRLLRAAKRSILTARHEIGG